MAQIVFHQNHCAYLTAPSGAAVGLLTIINNGTGSFFPVTPTGSLNWQNANFLFSCSSAAASSWSATLSVGLYTLTGSTLSMLNSASGSTTNGAVTAAGWMKATATSAASTLTPGTYFLCFLMSTGGISSISLFGDTSGAGNAFPAGFVGGALTASTNALPATVATSDLDTTGGGDVFEPFIILTA